MELYTNTDYGKVFCNVCNVKIERGEQARKGHERGPAHQENERAYRFGLMRVKVLGVLAGVESHIEVLEGELVELREAERAWMKERAQLIQDVRRVYDDEFHMSKERSGPMYRRFALQDFMRMLELSIPLFRDAGSECVDPVRPQHVGDG